MKTSNLELIREFIYDTKCDCDCYLKALILLREILKDTIKSPLKELK